MKVLGVVLGGGRGTRLFPLTKLRSKPAVPLAGKYRLIDVPISNCINSGINQVFVLTQFNSASLNRHIAQAYKFDVFSRGFVEILAAEQTIEDTTWFQGSADAVRKSLRHLLRAGVELVLIVSGDALYRMDYRPMIQRHIAHKADVTIGVIPVAEQSAPSFGLLKVTGDDRVVEFCEKPGTPDEIHRMASPMELVSRCGVSDPNRCYLASMGIYLFNTEVLEQVLADKSLNDFGSQVIPSAIATHRVFAELFGGYWEDIGTIRTFYEANLALCRPEPPFDFFDTEWPIYSHARFLPPSKIRRCEIENAVIAEGCVINGATIRRSIIGLRSVIGKGATIEDSIIMGNDEYRHREKRDIVTRVHYLETTIRRGALIRHAIIDKDARIGEDAVIVPPPDVPDIDADGFYIRDGIVIVPKGAQIPDHFRLAEAIPVRP